MITVEDIRSIVRANVTGFDMSQLSDEQPFESAGIDSLDHSMILLAVEEKTGHHIPDEDVPVCSSIAGIVSYLNKKQGS
jgi:acyl carrier protein